MQNAWKQATAGRLVIPRQYFTPDGGLEGLQLPGGGRGRGGGGNAIGARCPTVGAYWGHPLQVLLLQLLRLRLGVWLRWRLVLLCVGLHLLWVVPHLYRPLLQTGALITHTHRSANKDEQITRVENGVHPCTHASLMSGVRRPGNGR